jgi:hypothetical protein
MFSCVILVRSSSVNLHYLEIGISKLYLISSLRFTPSRILYHSNILFNTSGALQYITRSVEVLLYTL